MATIASAQSGYWHAPTTWAGGVVPNPYNDDPVIAGGHVVTVAENYPVSLYSGRLLTVEPGASLVLHEDLTLNTGASLDVAGNLDVLFGRSLYVYGFLTVAESGSITATTGHIVIQGDAKYVYGSLSVTHTGTLAVQSYCNLYIHGSFYLGPGAACYLYEYACLHLAPGSLTAIHGDLANDSASVYVRGYAEVAPGGLAWVGNSGGMYADGAGRLHLHGSMLMDNWSYFAASDGGRVVVHPDGDVTVLTYSTYSMDSGGTTDVHGLFAVHYDAFLAVNAGGRVRVFRTLRMTGQVTGGGRIDLMRREARIDDYTGNPLVYCDHAYGFGPTLVA